MGTMGSEQPAVMHKTSHVTLAKVTKLYEVSCMVIVATTQQGQSIVVMPLSVMCTKMMTSLLLPTLLLTLHLLFML